MILTCPNCSTRFNFPKEALGEKGVKVRCTECLEVWHQEAIEDSLFDALDEGAVQSEESQIAAAKDDDLKMPEGKEGTQESVDSLFDTIEGPDPAEDVPEENKQDEADSEEGKNAEDSDSASEDPHEGEIIAAVKAEEPKAEGEGENVKIDRIPRKKTTSFGAAALIFVLVFVYLLISSASIMRAYTPAHAFYSLLGMGMEQPGKDLIFDKVKATVSKNKISIEGKIVNLGSEIREIPMIEASIRGHEDHVDGMWYIPPPVQSVESEGEIGFASEYDLHGDFAEAVKDGKTIHFRFVIRSTSDPMPKMAENNHGETTTEETDPEEEEDFVQDLFQTKTGAEGGDNIHAPH